MNRRPEIAHVNCEHTVKIIEQLDASHADRHFLLLRTADLATKLGFETIPQSLGRTGQGQKHPDFIE